MPTSRTKEPFHWRTSIAYKTQPKIVIRGYDLNDLTGNVSIAEMAYLVWRGELPSPAHAQMLDAIMVVIAEHAFSPSSAAARMVASGGVPLHVGVAGGMLTIGDFHGTLTVPRRSSKGASVARNPRASHSIRWRRSSFAKRGRKEPESPAFITRSTSEIRARRGSSNWDGSSASPVPISRWR